MDCWRERRGGRQASRQSERMALGPGTPIERRVQPGVQLLGRASVHGKNSEGEVAHQTKPMGLDALTDAMAQAGRIWSFVYAHARTPKF